MRIVNPHRGGRQTTMVMRNACPAANSYLRPWPLSISIGVFAVAALMAVLGGRLARSGDVLADRTHLGEALFGALFFGGMISLSGIVMTATAAFDDYPRLGFSNAIGGIAAQTAALGAADLAYRRAYLEQSVLLLVTYVAMIIMIAWGVNGA